MKTLSDFLKRDLDRIKNITDGSELYVLFFRISQLMVIAFCIYDLILVAPILSAGLPSEFRFATNSYWIYAMVFWQLATLVASEIGLYFLTKDKTLGAWIGLVLSIYFFFSLNVFTALGLFGLYAFLNPSAQKRHWLNAPEWFKGLLSTCQINWTK